MTYFRRVFGLGRINQDADNRLLPNGEYRDAQNIVVLNNEGSNEGAVKKALSNKRLTNLNFGPNPKTQGQFTYEARNRIYWLVLSDTGSYLCEWDHVAQAASFILADTRPVNERVFNLKEDYLVTSISIIPSDDPTKELMLLTDDNMQPLCFNISRARNYGVNGFEKEDIYLIKKPPRYSPTVAYAFTGGKENYMEEEFLTFSYRYKYLDGEYSALSDYTIYQFAPGKFALDFPTGENLAMVNRFNAVRVGINTGDSRVTEIQVVVKKSNSNTLFIVETFNKEDEEWGDDEEKEFLFANDKRYIALPERELYRSFDNVPLKAKAMTVIGNRPVFGNYLEGYDLLDENGKKVSPQYDLSIISNSLEGIAVPVSINATDPENLKLEINFTDITLSEGSNLSFVFDMEGHYEEGAEWIDDGHFNYTFSFVLGADYANALELSESEEWETFVTNVMTNLFLANYTITVPDDSEQVGFTPFLFEATTNTITLTGPTVTYEIDNTPELPEDDDFTTRIWHFWFEGNSSVEYLDFAVASSIKTNRSVEVGLVYEDEFNRSTTVLTGKNNTIYIPQSLSTSQNKIKVSISSLPPAWADRCKVVVKTPALAYNVIYATIFYEEGMFRWVKLDGANIDKVDEGDTLIVKADQSGPRPEIFKVRVLEKTVKERNFLSTDDEDNGIVRQEPGTYIKIKGDNIAMNNSQAQFFYYNDTNEGEVRVSLGEVVQYYDPLTELYVDLPIAAGTRITITFVYRNPIDDDFDTTFEETFYSNGDHEGIEQWFDEEFTGYGNSDGLFFIEFERSGDGSNKQNMVFRSESDEDNYGVIAASLTVYRVDGVVIFETEPVSTDTEIFYSTGQEFDIVDGYHTGNLQDQSPSLPAEIELDFFNCYAMGNGAECYQVKDVLNKNSLNIDLRPNATSISGYRAVRRNCDLTYGEPFEESTNINGVNVFNLATANFKDNMEKSYGAIKRLLAREMDIVVFQEEKVGKVLYDKDAIYTAEGSPNLISMPGVLGRYISYATDFGIGNHPESISVDDHGRIKYASVKKGVIARLSQDGIEPIIYGLKGFFRDLFLSLPNAKILSGYDPYLDVTAFSIGNEPVRLVEYQCGNSFIKSGQSEDFTYIFKLNNLGGDVVIAYVVTEGSATITAEFDGEEYVASNVTGSGTLTFERTSLVENEVTVTVTPIDGDVSYMITNTCPTGTELTIVSLVLNDDEDTGTTMTDRYKSDGSPFASTAELFNDPPVTRFESVTGIEGQGSFPTNGSLMTIQAFKDTLNSGHFTTTECNRLGYLITDTVYTEADYQDILDHPDTEFLTITTTGEEGLSETSSAQFVFSRTNTDQILYLIWDYTSRNPVISDDTANVVQGGTVVINVLDNDEVGIGAVVTVATQPEYGTATVNEDNEIEYTHDGSDNFADTFTYTVTENGCSSTATITISIGVTCGGSVTAGGSVGIYEVILNLGTDTGWCGVQFNAQGVPDRFELYWNDVKVADSLYVGDQLDPGPPVSYPGLLGEKTLDVYEYNGSSFIDTGDDETFTIVQDDIADNVTEATDGNGFLVFNKTAATPTTVRLRAIGPVGGTAWNLQNVICPTPEEELVEGEDFFAFGFFTEANRADTDKSVKLWRGTSPDKFYTNKFGQTNFTMYSEFSTNKFINDLTNWYELDATGNIVDTGTLP